jgi:hypothetical protein
MKKELVIITNTCYPVYSATGVLAVRAAKYLNAEYQVRMIALQDGEKRVWGMAPEGIELYIISQWRYKLNQLAANRCKKTTGIESKIYKCLYWLTRILGKLQSVFFVLDNQWWYEHKAYRLLNKLDADRKIDAILSVSAPIEAHFAANRFKKKHSDIYWCSYWGDLFSGRNFKQNIFVSLERMKAIENNLILSSDYVLATEEVYSIYQQRDLKSNGMNYVPYILNEELLQQKHEREKNANNNVVFTCMGSFNKLMRDPKYMLDVFTKLPDNYILDLYTGGCEELVQEYARKKPANIRVHGRVPYHVLVDNMMKSDVLINVGNSVMSSVPSKMMELMSCRKPILDFFYPGQRMELLDQYPEVLRIEMGDNLADVIPKIEVFANSAPGKCVDYHTITQLFPYNMEKNACHIVNQALAIKNRGEA